MMIVCLLINCYVGTNYSVGLLSGMLSGRQRHIILSSWFSLRTSLLLIKVMSGVFKTIHLQWR